MIARILMTRSIGLEGMSIYTLANPAMVLVITLAQLGLPTAIATLISKNKNKSKKIFISGLIISLIISISLMVVIIFFAPFLATKILKNTDVTMTIYGLALLVPLVSLSSLLKGYFIGHNLVKMTARSSIAEEGARIVFIVLFLHHFTKINPSYGAFGAVIGVCIGEVFQSIYLIFESNLKLYKRASELLSLNEIKPLSEIPEVLSLSIPITLSRLIGSLTYFLEPIIITNLMLKNGYSSSFIITEYGVYSGYAMPILLLPGFFSLAFSNYMLPILSNDIGNNNFKQAKKHFLKVIMLSLSVGFLVAIIFFFNNGSITYMLYKTTKGSNYIKKLAFPFVLYYLESPINTAMHALGLTKKAFFTTTISCIVRILILLIFTPSLGIDAISLSTLIEITTIIILNGYHILKMFIKNDVKAIIISH